MFFSCTVTDAHLPHRTRNSSTLPVAAGRAESSSQSLAGKSSITPSKAFCAPLPRRNVSITVAKVSPPFACPVSSSYERACPFMTATGILPDRQTEVRHSLHPPVRHPGKIIRRISQKSGRICRKNGMFHYDIPVALPNTDPIRLFSYNMLCVNIKFILF